MSLKKAFMIRPARRILEQCLNLQSGENLLVLTDTDKIEYAEIFALVGREMGAEVSLLAMAPRTRHSEELPKVVAAAMRAADAIVAPTTYSVNHTNARMEASRAGARLIFMPDVNDTIFRDGSLDIDFLERKQVIDQVARILEEGREIAIRSANGTSLHASISGKHAVPQSGICHEPGSISPPPCIEVAIAPDEGTMQGVMRVDGSVVPPGGILSSPVDLTFEDGRIIEIRGGIDAERLRKTLESYDSPEMYCPVELGMGMNPNAEIGRGGYLEDEAEFGTLHVGIGNGITFGSSIRAPSHMDLVMRDAEVEVDGRLILQDRHLYLDQRG